MVQYIPESAVKSFVTRRRPLVRAEHNAGASRRAGLRGPSSNRSG